MGGQRGYALLKLALLTIVISVLVTLLLQRLYYYQELAEKMRTELTLRTLGKALKLRMGQLMIGDQADRWRMLTEEDPFDWLERKPGNYCGTAAGLDEVRPGCWVYRQLVHELVYRPMNQSHLNMPSNAGLLRFRIEARFAAEASPTDDPAGPIAESVEIKPVEAYRWLDEPTAGQR